jgi:hypothetical protein
MGQPPILPPEMGNWQNITKTIEIPTPKPYNYIHVPYMYVIGNVCNTLDMAPGVNPNPRNWKLAEYIFHETASMVHI